MFNNTRTFGLTSGRVMEGLRSDMWNPMKVMSVRQIVVGGMVLIWAGRLGSFLIQVRLSLYIKQEYNGSFSRAIANSQDW
jgi:hypothetical protein